jgi:predicted  nucleic acid-binding Zn-ribbon protein
MADGASAPPEKPAATSVLQLRRTRFLGQQYADITKLRELAAQQDRLAAKYEQRISRLNTRIERLRHQATLLREKGQKVLSGVGEVEQEIKQHQRDIDAATSHRRGATLTSDITALHYRVRKLQQKVVDLQQKARTLELRAAQRTQKTAELKVKVDRLVEAAHLASQEATQYRQRADRLQLVSEQDTAPSTPSAAPAADAEASSAAGGERSEPPTDL